MGEIEMDTKFFLCSDLQKLEEALTPFDRVGSIGWNLGRAIVSMSPDGAAPCQAVNLAYGLEAVGLTYLDLNVLGGCAAILDCKPATKDFWELVVFIAVNGRHKLTPQACSTLERTGFQNELARLYAWWAWEHEHGVSILPDNEIGDVTNIVMTGINALAKILGDDLEMLRSGEEFRLKEEALNRASFVEIYQGVIVRVANVPTPQLFITPMGEIGRAVVSFLTDPGSLTISLAEPVQGVDCREIARQFWGEEVARNGRVDFVGPVPVPTLALNQIIFLRNAMIAALKGK